MLGIRLEEEVEKRLSALAAKTGRTKSYYARKAIEEKLDDWEDIANAIAVLESSGKRWTFEEAEAEFDKVERNG